MKYITKTYGNINNRYGDAVSARLRHASLGGGGGGGGGVRVMDLGVGWPHAGAWGVQLSPWRTSGRVGETCSCLLALV